MYSEEVLRFKKEDLKEFVIKYFKKLGVAEDDAAIVAEVMLEADLRGIPSHGLIRINMYYGIRLENGYMDPKASYKVISESETTSLIDGGNGLGHIVSVFAMNKAIEKAKISNLAISVVKNSDHYGIAAYYSMMALKHNMIGISLSNSQPLVAPTYGKNPILGTNPISIACPSYREYPFVLDMATSVVPSGKIQVYEKLKQKLPYGWGINNEGVVTREPDDIKSGGSGALLPLGGDDITSGYKGFGLALAVDILCAVLSGASVLNEVGFPDKPKHCDVSHFFMAINIEAFRPVIDFKKQMDHVITILKSSPKAKGKERIYIAGEKEFENVEKNKKLGIPLMTKVVDDLKKDGDRIGVPFNARPVMKDLCSWYQ